MEGERHKERNLDVRCERQDWLPPAHGWPGSSLRLHALDQNGDPSVHEPTLYPLSKRARDKFENEMEGSIQFVDQIVDQIVKN